ncbi:Protein FAR1-RELATED SEQUENCE 9 [Hibiscus syriacus]|uniref:Protein FAR1-RELATED SEQUENCE 9 n=1 Tax=Hibiscus syriacus TaxID=106335 RepID=A0A6A2ZGN7_HIBSY|nr:Protein FAR1-RELATED SEQUENCE 9 [Hibiscus syriacus]
MDIRPVNVDEFDDEATALDLENPLPFNDHSHVARPVFGPADPNLEPFEGMGFDSEQSARVFYNSYARRMGLSTRVSVYQRSRHDGSIICLQATADRHSDHNHELVPPDKVHCLRSHRHVSGPARSLIDALQAAGMCSSGVMSVLIKESGGINNVGFTKVDCQNYTSSSRQGLLGAEARENYNHFGDTVTFDTTYRTNRYRVPFAPFTGSNHHGQPVLFGCALLLNESESSFVWLFQTWLAAMSGRHPISITTDQDRIIRAAVARVFPVTRHRFCIWNVFREARDKLADVYHSHPTFEAEFQRCIKLTETVDEFESCWEFLLLQYGLGDNEWLQSMYNTRNHWVLVYLRSTFFGGDVRIPRK